jgi:hypothetical protein
MRWSAVATWIPRAQSRGPDEPHQPDEPPGKGAKERQ